MLRVVGGVLVASLVAPYVSSLFIIIIIELVGAPMGTDLIFGAPSLLEDEFFNIIKILVLGTLGVIWFGIPILLAAGTLAFLLHVLSLTSKHHAVATAAGLGCMSLPLLFSNEQADLWIFPLAGLLSGAICGWIYWRIAVGGRPKAPVL